MRSDDNKNNGCHKCYINWISSVDTEVQTSVVNKRSECCWNNLQMWQLRRDSRTPGYCVRLHDGSVCGV